MMDNMNDKLWSRLPKDMVERVLSFLSVPVLCRFRTVCKRRNSLIRDPQFGDLCVQHARQRNACFIVTCYNIKVEYEESNGEDFNQSFDMFNYGWSFLDLNERHWYTIKCDNMEVFDHCFDRDGCRVAMDGGLVCECFEHDNHVAVVISNPIANTWKKLPSYSFNRITGLSQVNIVVDNDSQAYKVFLMPYVLDNHYEEKLRSDVDNPLMAIYDSATTLWRKLTNPPIPQISDVCINVQCSVFYDGLLYILISSDIGARSGDYVRGFQLWSYDHVEDIWSDTCVNLHVLELADPQLLVSDNRLFLASWLQEPSDTTRPHNDHASLLLFEVREVNLWDRICSTALLRMTGALVAQVFDMPLRKFYREGAAPFRLAAFGFGKSFVLVQSETSFGEYSSGVSIVYDLTTNLWDLLPKNTWSSRLNVGDRTKWIDYGKPMHLTLPASTLGA